MAFDGVQIGISDGLPERRRFCLGCCRVSGCPGLENALGAVATLRVFPHLIMQFFVADNQST